MSSNYCFFFKLFTKLHICTGIQCSHLTFLTIVLAGWHMGCICFSAATKVSSNIFFLQTKGICVQTILQTSHFLQAIDSNYST